MNINDLKSIQSDLQRAACDLESVSVHLAGHLLYMQRNCVNTLDAADVVMQISKLDASVEDLRDVALRIDC